MPIIPRLPHVLYDAEYNPEQRREKARREDV
jgi:hypothetical protein